MLGFGGTGYSTIPEVSNFDTQEAFEMREGDKLVHNMDYAEEGGGGCVSSLST